jgi:hypothetical protein
MRRDALDDIAQIDERIDLQAIGLVMPLLAPVGYLPRVMAVVVIDAQRSPGASWPLAATYSR